MVEVTEEGMSLASLRDRFNKMRTFWGPIYEEAQADDKYMAGDQWPDQIRKDREEEGRPVLTYNLLPAFVRQITGRVRQERPQIRVKPVESDRTQTPKIRNVQDTKDYSLADVYQGIIRNIEHISRASTAYDTAFAHCVEHGFGAFMINTAYSPHDPFVQDITIERVKNPYLIYMDPSAMESDYSDAQDAFVFGSMTKAAFESKYPGKTPGSFDVGAESGIFDSFFDRDAVVIATYYWIENMDDEVIKMTNGRVHYLSLVEDILDEM